MGGGWRGGGGVLGGSFWGGGVREGQLRGGGGRFGVGWGGVGWGGVGGMICSSVHFLFGSFASSSSLFSIPSTGVCRPISMYTSLGVQRGVPGYRDLYPQVQSMLLFNLRIHHLSCRPST